MPRPGRLRRKVFVNRAMPPLASARLLERRPEVHRSGVAANGPF